MLNVRLAGDHLYGKQRFTWLSLVMSMLVCFCAVLVSTRCFLDEIRDLIEFLRVFLPTLVIYNLQDLSVVNSVRFVCVHGGWC